MVRWDPRLSIGVPEIDAQHESLFQYASTLESLALAGDPDRRAEEALRFLSDYASRHFAAEELLMRESGFPGLEEHVQEHREFKRRLASLEPQWESEGASSALVMALVGFVDMWLREHIPGRDQAIADHVAPGTKGA